jgi:non-lysosomal glucosylceramidase
VTNARFHYSGSRTREISFPLGGIGTGCVGLAGNGRLVDWEIFNRPSKGSTFGFTHLAVRAEEDGKVLDARALMGDLPAPYTGSFTQGEYNSFGFGPPRDSLAGLPHFRESSFTGEFPVAEMRLRDPRFPGAVSLRAWNPLIPRNDRDSGIPAAFFEVEIENTLPRPLAYTVCFSVKNPFPQAEAANRFEREEGVSLVSLSSRALAADDPRFGDLCVATDAAAASVQEYWFRGSWFDNLAVYWRDFTAPGPFRNRTYDASLEKDGVAYGKDDYCLLAAHVTAEPRQAARCRFVLSWSFPTCANHWNPEQKDGAPCRPQRTWRNWYATQWKDASQSARYALSAWDRLWAGTEAFKEALFGASLPPEAIDAVSANLSTLKSPTVMRLEDGTFYGFEGCHPGSGCCEGSCTHVWNYAYALPFLFPALERSMREADFRYNQAADGGMGFRLQLPLGRPRSGFRACVDGQMGGVIKTYRDWKICGDTEWLRRQWKAVKAGISYAWSPLNLDRWDADKDGVMEGRQHHTLDMELFGPSSWLTGFYLAALKAGAEMARALGEEETAREYHALFTRGKAWVDEHLFNGEYYQQAIDLADQSILKRYDSGASMAGSTLGAYWDAEHGQVKYQVADGCVIDQVIGQWHANLCGLGEIFDPVKTNAALHAVYRHNFKPSMREHANPCRLYCLNDEAGAVICSYPRSRPAIGITYAEETMNGFEYQAACHMIQEGMLEEGLELVRAVRGRYDGEKRNPWNEIECGSNYARSMASFSLLLAYSGFQYDMARGSVGFDPRIRRDAFSCPWSLDAAWGVLSMTRREARLSVTEGALRLERFTGAWITHGAVKDVMVGGERAGFTLEQGALRFTDPVTVEPGRDLVVRRGLLAAVGRA